MERFWALSLNQKLTILIAAVSVATAIISAIVAFATFLIARDSRDLKEAIKQLSTLAKESDEQTDILVNELEATRTQSGIMSEQVDLLSKGLSEQQSQSQALSAQADSARQQSVATTQQINQNADLFALQQRPYIDFLLEKEQFVSDKPVVHAGEMRWNYAYKNYGLGPAYDLVSYPAISVWGRPFKEERRLGAKVIQPNGSQWGTARYFFNPGETDGQAYMDAPLSMGLTLRVRFEYRDGMGRKYKSHFCRHIAPNRTIVDCSQVSNPN